MKPIYWETVFLDINIQELRLDGHQYPFNRLSASQLTLNCGTANNHFYCARLVSLITFVAEFWRRMKFNEGLLEQSWNWNQIWSNWIINLVRFTFERQNERCGKAFHIHLFIAIGNKAFILVEFYWQVRLFTLVSFVIPSG